MIDISRLDPNQLDRFIHMQSIVARQQSDAAKVKAARDYYSGEHPVLLTQRQEEYLGKQLTQGDFAFNHNLVKPVIDTLRERLNVVGFTVNGASAEDLDTEKPDPNAQLAALMWDWWKHNRMESQQIRLYRRALRDWKSYVMVDYDNEYSRPRFCLHEVDDGTTGVMLHRDSEDENRILFASRYFYTFNPLEPGQTGIQRKTVYLPGEIRKYQSTSIASPLSTASMWTQVSDADDLAWPIPWRDMNGNPLGVAVVEFQNPGGSEVELIAGLQNALNKSWLDLLAAADTSGFPIITMNYKDAQAMPIGIEDDEDLTGSDEFLIAPGRAIEIFGGDIRRIEGANLDHMINVVWSIVDGISGISRTPQQYLKPFISANMPSGESMKQLEAGLVAKATERQLLFGEAWADVMKLAYKVALTFGNNIPQIDDPVIGVQWADANIRMEKTEADVAMIHKNLGVPVDAVWQKAGYTPEQIAQFKQNALSQRAIEIANIASAMRVSQQGQQPQTNPQTNGTVPVKARNES